MNTLTAEKRVSGHPSWTSEDLAFVRNLARNTLVADIREVTLCFLGTTPSKYLMHKDEVKAFVAASKRLHFQPGVNPANGRKTAQVYRIEVEELLFEGPYWWSTPDLDGSNTQAGARLLSGSAMTREIVFEDPAHVVEDEDD